jgi:hypothetical protein
MGALRCCAASSIVCKPSSEFGGGRGGVGRTIPHDVLQEFAAAGLARISFPGVAVVSPTGERGGGFGRNELGALFVEITTPADDERRESPKPGEQVE